MGDIFESDMDRVEDISALEDNEDYAEESEDFVYPDNLYKVKIEYSVEGLYAQKGGNMDLQHGDYVVIPTKYGKDIAVVLGKAEKPVGIRPNDIIRIDRKASEKDLKRFFELRDKEANASAVFKEKVKFHNLDMKLIAVHFLLDEQKALFFFSSDNRVDFRELVKDLVAVFKMRIELRQIGVRDESRITGGLGICGRPYCCSSVSDKLRPVSIKMAKDQNLSLNSSKISGQCGRLLCCMSYEYDWYAEARKKLPPEGIKISYDGTMFRITEVNPLTSMIKMLGEDGRLVEINAKRFSRDGNRWRVI